MKKQSAKPNNCLPPPLTRSASCLTVTGLDSPGRTVTSGNEPPAKQVGREGNDRPADVDRSSGDSFEPCCHGSAKRGRLLKHHAVPCIGQSREHGSLFAGPAGNMPVFR